MRFIGAIVILSLLINFSLSLSIRKHVNKYNSIPSDEIDLWLSDHLSETPKINEPPPSFVKQDDDEKTINNKSDGDSDGESKDFSKSSSSNAPRPVITLKNSTEAIPFTRVDSSVKIEGFNEANGSSDKVEEGVGPAVVFDYDSEYAESETGYSPSSQSSSSSVGPEDNSYENGDLKIEISDLKPVYIKPPSGFKPVLYPNREMDGVHPIASAFDDYSGASSSNQPKVTLLPPKEPYPYPYPFGLTSWSLGGIRGIQRGGFWESMGSDAALGLPVRPFKGNPVSVLEWINLDGSSKDNNNYKPPLPPPSVSSPDSTSSLQSDSTPDTDLSNRVPLASWMFGGVRQLSPFWQMRPMVIEKVEYVPFQPSSSQSARPSKLSSVNSYWIISDNEANPVE